MNENLNKLLLNSIKKRRLFIGDTMALDSDYNIKNYLSDIQKQVLLEKIYCNTKRALPKINNNSHRYSRNYIIMNNNDNEKKKENNNKIKQNLIFNLFVFISHKF